MGRVEHVDLLLVATRGEQDGALGDAVADREHRLQHGLVGIVTEATDFTRTHHVDTEHGVGLLQASEGELRCLDPYIVEVEGALIRLLDSLPEHDTRGQLDEVNLQHLAHEGEAT